MGARHGKGSILYMFLAVTLLVVGGFEVGSVAIASASGASDNCTHPADNGYLCVFTQTSGAGTRVRFFWDNTSWGTNSVNNNDYSAANRGTQYASIYNYYAGSWASSTKVECLPVDSWYNFMPNPGVGSANRFTTAAC